MKKTLIAAVLAVALVVGFRLPSEAILIGPEIVFDPSNFAKNSLTELHTLDVTINQATQISNQLRQLAYQLQSLRNIPSGTWGNVVSELAALQRVVKVGSGISYTDAGLSTEFRALYPGYGAPTDYTLDGMQGAYQAAGLQSNQFATEDGVFADLESRSNGATGHMQAIQVGNMIAVQEVQQLEKLRQLQMAQMQGEFSYLATQQQSDVAKYATLRAWLDSQSGYKSSE